MQYELHHLPEVLVGISIFLTIIIAGYYYSTKKDVSDDTRMFR